MDSKKIVILTGAGISAESGLKTFRDANGLWEGHDVMTVASPQGWQKNPELVLEFYNVRRRQLLGVQPNEAHYQLARLQDKYDVTIITQNVDDLHERSGSREVIHLHGELLKVSSVNNPKLVYHWVKDLQIGDVASDGSQLRPFVVWFGEPVPMIEPAAKKIEEADVLLIIGTSLQVYPAASLIQFAKYETPVIYVDPSPTISYELSQRRNVQVIRANATNGVVTAINLLS